MGDIPDTFLSDDFGDTRLQLLAIRPVTGIHIKILNEYIEENSRFFIQLFFILY